MSTTETTPRPLAVIANEIVADWTEPWFAAVPYIEALKHLRDINDRYGWDPAEEIVLRFLGNAKTWKGETARRIKAELREMLR